MRCLLVCAFAASVVLLTYAQVPTLCDKTDEQLRAGVKCLKEKASPSLRRTLDRLKARVGCSADTCTVEYLCSHKKAHLAVTLTDAEKAEFRQLVEQCNAVPTKTSSNFIVAWIKSWFA
ncbi:antimicrobial peptide microplusin-like [Ixodes scapularis]|uniref:antimicrobial peptide microplusin-like n=1 Tax=Ixodes scapularis TaxID=6945 RepID=UPI0011252DEF|nr:antimicrobial peptide microplusin-like [Ixodes scapularis]